jgi:hypothetical protein
MPGGRAVPGDSRSTLDRAVSAFTDDARRDEARLSRAARQDRAVAAGLSATFLGTLVELCETGTAAVVVTGMGEHHRGQIVAVGSDVVVLSSVADRDSNTDRRTFLSPTAIDAIRETGGLHRRSVLSVPEGPRMGDLLDELGTGSRISVGTLGGNRFMGTLLRVGADQLSLRLDGENDVLTLPLASIAQAVINP